MGLHSPENSPLQENRSEWAIDHNHINKYFPDTCQDTVCFVVNNFFRSYGHQFLYDPKTLKASLEDSGFVEVITYGPGKRDDRNFRNIESHENVIGEEINLFETFLLEATKAKATTPTGNQITE